MRRISIVIAAQGPKALEVAGEIGDGWMAPWSGVEAFTQNLETLARRANPARTAAVLERAENSKLDL